MFSSRSLALRRSTFAEAQVKQGKSHSRHLKYFGLATTITVVSVGAVAHYLEQNVPRHSKFRPSALDSIVQTLVSLRRFARSLNAAFWISADYKYLHATYYDYDSDEYRKARSRVHSRSAERLLRLCKEQGSIYVKMGQHLSSMTHAIPPEYTTPMKSLQDKAKPSPFEDILPVLSKEIGPLEAVLQNIDPNPVAVASLAQVHRGFLRDDARTPVAIKVQHPKLREKVESDLATVCFLSKLLSNVFGGFDTTWLVAAFRENLSQEMDFLTEAASGERAARNFKRDKSVVIPAVYSSLSTSKVLTMEFIEGARVDDSSYFAAHDINRDDVALAVVDAFAQMVFFDGFVHCDGHPGNLMIRANHEAPKGFELVILDHGLYRELDDSFRKAYCLLWRGLISRSASDVQQACRDLGAPGLEEIFSLALLHRSWANAKDSKTDIRRKLSREEIKELRQKFKNGEINVDEESLKTLSHDLLLIFKMNSLVRSIVQATGADIDRFRVNCRFAIRGLHHETHNRSADSKVGTTEDRSRCSWGVPIAPMELADRLALEVRLVMFDALILMYRLWTWFKGSSSAEPAESKSVP